MRSTSKEPKFETEWTQAKYGAEIHARVSYGMVDDKGRAVGGLLSIRGPGPKDWQGGSDIGFSVCIEATRNGDQFGALRSYSGSYATLEEAKAALDKKAWHSKLRFERKFGRCQPNQDPGARDQPI